MALFRVRLELARCHDFPSGSAERGYDFVAALTSDGRLDIDEWRAHKAQCVVHRFWHGEPDEHGKLAHARTGWFFHYEGEDLDEDEPLFKLDRHSIRDGEYLSITERDGKLWTFRVVRVTPLDRK